MIIIRIYSIIHSKSSKHIRHSNERKSLFETHLYPAGIVCPVFLEYFTFLIHAGHCWNTDSCHIQGHWTQWCRSKVQRTEATRYASEGIHDLISS